MKGRLPPSSGCARPAKSCNSCYVGLPSGARSAKEGDDKSDAHARLFDTGDLPESAESCTRPYTSPRSAAGHVTCRASSPPWTSSASVISTRALVATAIAFVPAIVVYVRGRQLARYADDPALPERLFAGRNKTSGVPGHRRRDAPHGHGIRSNLGDSADGDGVVRRRPAAPQDPLQRNVEPSGLSLVRHPVLHRRLELLDPRVGPACAGALGGRARLDADRLAHDGQPADGSWPSVRRK